MLRSVIMSCNGLKKKISADSMQEVTQWFTLYWKFEHTYKQDMIVDMVYAGQWGCEYSMLFKSI